MGAIRPIRGRAYRPRRRRNLAVPAVATARRLPVQRRRVGDRLGRRRGVAGSRAGAAPFEPFADRPVAPDGDLAVAGQLALGALAGGDPQRLVEHLAGQRFHRLAVQIAAGVHVHLARQQLVARCGGDELHRRHEREVGDRAVAGHEEDQVGTGGDLAGDALQIVAGAVHEVQPRFGDRRRVVDHAGQRHVRCLLGRRSDRLQGDVVQAAQLVAPRRVAGCRLPVARGPRLEAFHLLQESGGGGPVLDRRQHVALGADQLVGLRQDGGAAGGDHLARHRAGQRVAGDAGERVGAPALQRDVQRRQRQLASAGVSRGAQQRQHGIVVHRVARGRGDDRHAVEPARLGFGAGGHIRPAHGARRMIQHHGAGHVGMDQEADQRALQQLAVVRRLGPAALGVRDRHHAVRAAERARDSVQPCGQRDGSGAGVRVDRQHDHVVARAEPALAAVVPGELQIPLRRGQRLGRCDLVHPRRLRQRLVLEVRIRGEIQLQVALRQRVDHAGVADPVAGIDVAQRPAERITPGEQLLPPPDRGDREPMPFEHRVRQRKPRVPPRPVVLDFPAGGQGGQRDRDVVGAAGEPRDGRQRDGPTRVGRHRNLRSGGVGGLQVDSPASSSSKACRPRSSSLMKPMNSLPCTRS